MIIHLKNEEKAAIKIIAMKLVRLKEEMLLFQRAIPESLVLPIVNGAIIGIARDIVDACITSEIDTLAKYWLVSTIYAEREIANNTAPTDVIPAYKELKERILKLLEENKIEISWPDFDKI